MSQERVEKISDCLQQALSPTHLMIRDDSHKHIGHAGAQDGRGHFSIEIASKKLAGQTRIKQHQIIYEALGKLLQTDIHALQIKVVTAQNKSD